MPMPTFPLARLGGFRSELHACLTRRADALFELGDALLCAQAVSSLPHLSLEPIHQRGWAAPMPGWPVAGSTPSGSATSWPTACRPPTRRCLRSMSRPGRGVTLSAHPSAATTTIPGGIRPASRSSPAGPSSGSPSWALTGTPGPPRWMLAGCTPPTTPTRPPLARSARCLAAWTPVGRAAVRL